MIMMGDRRRQVVQILGPRKEPEAEAPGPEAGHSIAQEMIEAFHAKDAPALWEAIKAAFSELDAAPHVEGPHVGE